MSTAAQEAERLAEVPTERYDRIVRLAQAIFEVPIASLNLIGEDEQFAVAAVGTPTATYPLSAAICGHTVLQDDIFEVPDLREDERFREHSIVIGPSQVRHYAGVPLRAPSGQKVGALCLLDREPGRLDAGQREMLTDLGAVLEREIAVQAEMLRAGEVQRLLLPDQPPELAGVEVAGRVQQATEAGGDFFDWQVVPVPLGSRRLQVVLADVMGKGLAASLIASEMRAVLRTHSHYVEVDEAVRRTNDTTSRDLESNGRFVTLWAGRLDPVDGSVEFVDAGHGLAVVASERGVRRLAQEHPPLGVPVPSRWSSVRDVLAPDESLVVVSDGVFDVFGGVDEALDAVRAVAVSARSCVELVDRTLEFVSGQGATDDVTVVAVRTRPTGLERGDA
ncbi:PP2C family protein-serine/threonine phosphatase [Cellulomonas algicola]|uniref:PP2C family protein-serine/threonine phosphatase n=1 Tax=Cellulomonas algicola TaxID=2071633 RepID=UPI001C3FAD3B|nr:GAF domain-containing SpoIIE family protein phosphatase [Cellulomonas algicola]